MKSSSGAHYIGLDHLRALAAFMVFAWHFKHSTSGYPVPCDFAPLLPPRAPLGGWQTGVALFMTPSGYLFAKLRQGRDIRYALSCSTERRACWRSNGLSTCALRQCQ